MKDLKKTIVNIFADVLLSSSSELDTSLEMSSIGVDSILAAQLAAILSRKLKIKLSPMDLFESITIDNLIVYISKKYHHKNSSFISADKVVIVGMACRFPQSNNKEEYWGNLLTANNCITKTDRWKQNGGESATGGFLEDISLFDSSFFRISPNEARCMDPQQRILLEVVQHAIEDANVSLADLRKQACGVFVTSLPGDYKFEMAKHPDKVFNTHSFLGNAFSALGGRISYFYDFKGPSINLDTACSSSLTAIHQAYLNIKSGSCDAAIIGAVSVFSTTEMFEFSKQSNMASAQGRCAVFDDTADGFVPSEGAASIVLMKESEALRLNLRIYACIEGIESNHDGQSNGIMAPNSHSQANLIERTYQKFGLSIDQLALVEAHGTGTKLGDPIELRGLTQALLKLDPSYNCYLGASKSVIGHTLVCSGLASVIKLLLAFQHQTIPPLPKIDVKNEYIDFGNCELNMTPIQWPKEKPLAAISAFGFTGSNSHLIMSHYPQEITPPIGLRTEAYFFCFSAHTEFSLQERLKQYISFVKNLKEEDFIILSEQLSIKFQHHDLRVAIIASNRKELLSSMEQALKNVSFSGETTVIEGCPTSKLNTEQELLLFQWIKKENIQEETSCFSIIPLSLPAYPFDRKSFWITEKYKEALTQRVENQDDLKSSILQQLKKSIYDLLGYDPSQIKEVTSLLDYGIDSLSAIQLIAPFKNLSSAMKPQDLFRFDSIEKLAEEIAKRSNTKLENENKLNTEDRLILPEAINEGILEIKTPYSKYLKWLTTGSGIKVVLMFPPLNTNYLGWIQQLKFMSKIGYKVYIPIYPGHYNNDFEENSFDVPAILEEVSFFVKNVLKVNAVPIVGWSLGGCFCMEFADRYPELVESIVLISTAPKFEQDIFSKTIMLHEELEARKSYLDIILGNQEPFVKRIGAGASLSILKYYYDFLESFDITNRLSTLHMPVLIVSGENDDVITANDIELLKEIPRHELMILADHGHFIPLTASRQFNDRIAAFMIKNESIQLS